MDDLNALKEFRAGVAGALPGDPARERTIAAIRALIEQETAAGPARAPRRLTRRLPRLVGVGVSRRRASVVALAAAVVAVAFAVLPIGGSSPSLAGQALAAIGSGSVLHVVAEMPTGRQSLDLQSGTTTPIFQQEEIWFDQSRGLRRDVTRVNGVITDDTFQSPEGGWTPHGVIYDCTWIAAHPQAATKARVSCNISGDNGTTPHVVPRPKPTLDPGLAGFADGYRDALASGTAREDGSGVVDGQPVDWLVFTTKQGDERVALDAVSHKPILIEGPSSSRLRITTIETTDTAAGRFVRPSADETPLEPTRGEATDQQDLALQGAAIAAGYPNAVWAGASIDGLPLASATVQHVVSSYYQHARPQEAGTGLQLQYGSLTANGHRDFTKPYVTVSEAPTPVLAMAYMWGGQRGSIPPAGQLYLQQSPSFAVGFTMVAGHAISIEASSGELLTAAARALTPAK